MEAESAEVTEQSDHTDATQPNTSRYLLAIVVLVAMLIGANFSVIKEGLEYTTPFLMAAMRTVVGGTFLIVLATLRGERLPTDRRDLANIFVVGFSITTVSSALLVYGIGKTPAGVSSLISSTMPLFTAVLSFVLLSARVSRLGAIGLIVGFGGTAVLASPTIAGDAGVVGIVSLVFSAMAWSFGTVYMKWRDFSRVSPIMLVGVQLIMSAMMLVPFALVVEGTADTEWGWSLYLPLLYAAIPANAVTFSLMATVVRRATPTVAASTAYLIPLFGVFFSWLLRGESLGIVEAVGGVLVVCGVYLVVTANTRRL